MKNENNSKSTGKVNTNKNDLKNKQAEDKGMQSILSQQSLVKYDTPFLVSTTISNKKTLEELDENNENAEIFLRNMIKRGDETNDKSEYGDISVKDALNKILPPKKTYQNDQLWVQYVSCTPVTKVEVLNLQQGLDRLLQTMQARETGICPIRERLYNECFDELIRQVTINCLERGILLMRIKKEIEMTINSYQTLYESAIAYGIRTSLMAEESKNKLSTKIKSIDDECDHLEDMIKSLEKEIQMKLQNDGENRERENKMHEQFVIQKREENEKLKKDIKDKVSANFKS